MYSLISTAFLLIAPIQEISDHDTETFFLQLDQLCIVYLENFLMEIHLLICVIPIVLPQEIFVCIVVVYVLGDKCVREQSEND